MIFTNTNSGSKQKWTREQDAKLVALANEGKGRADIAKACGHPENSITYRVRQIKKAEAALLEAGADPETLTIEDVLDSIKY